MSGVAFFRISNFIPIIPTTFLTDGAPAVPALNKIKFAGGSLTKNNPNGIEFDGSGNVVTGSLTNRFTVSSSTSNNTPVIIGSLIIGGSAPTSFNVSLDITGIKGTAPQGAVGYSIFATVFLTGGITPIAVLVGQNKILNETDGTGGTADLRAADVNFVVSGTDNLLSIQVTGVGADTINWSGVATFAEAS